MDPKPKASDLKYVRTWSYVAVAISAAQVLAAVALTDSSVRVLANLTASTVDALAFHLAFTSVFLTLAWLIVNDFLESGQKRSWSALGTLIMMSCGFLHTAFAGEALIYHFSTHWAVALLIVPAITCFAFVPFEDVVKAGEEKDKAKASSIMADEGTPEPEKTARQTLLASIVVTAIMGCYFALTVLGFWYYYRFRQALFEDWPIGQIDIVRALGRMAISSGPIIIAGLVMMFALFLGAGLYAAAVQWRTKTRFSNSDRALTTKEIAYLENARAVLNAIPEHRGVSPWISYPLFIVAFGAVIALPLSLWHFLEWLYIETIEQERSQGFAWAVYDQGLGPSSFVLIWLSFLMFVSGLQLLSRRWPWLYAYGSSKAGVASSVVTTLRRGQINIDEPFDAEMVVSRQYQRFDKAIFVATSITLPVYAFFLYHDLCKYDLFTPSYIETVDYWTLETARFSYADVQSIGVKCTVDKEGDPSLTYEVRLPPKSIDLLDERFLRVRIDAYEKVDAELRKAGARTEVIPKKPWFSAEEPGIAPNCPAAVRKRYGEEMGTRLLKLLRRP